MRVNIYDSELQSVTSMPGSGDVLFITFGELMSRPIGTNFWGDKIFEKLGVPGIGFVAKASNWYPRNDTLAAIRLVREHIKDCHYKRIVCYGFSMGAYAALRYGKLVGADTIIAFSPQYSISPRDVGSFDKRYSDLYRPDLHDEMKLCADDIAPDTTIFVDRSDAADDVHVTYIEALQAIDVVLMSSCRHDTVRLASETGITPNLFSVLLSTNPGPTRVAALRSIVRGVRRKSFSYWFNTAKRIRDTKPEQLDCWASAFQEAHRLRPEPPIAIVELCESLLRAGRWHDAMPHVQQVARAMKFELLKTRSTAVLDTLIRASKSERPAQSSSRVDVEAKDPAELRLAACLGDDETVKSSIAAVLYDDGSSPSTLADAADVARAYGLHAEAVLLLHRLIEIEGYSPLHRLNLAEALTASDAKQRARKVLSLCKPEDFPQTAFIRLWNAMRNVALFEPAAAFVDLIVAHDPHDPFRRLHLVSSLLDMRRHDEARDHLDQALSDLPVEKNAAKRATILQAAWGASVRGNFQSQAERSARLYICATPPDGVRPDIRDWLEKRR